MTMTVVGVATSSTVTPSLVETSAVCERMVARDMMLDIVILVTVGRMAAVTSTLAAARTRRISAIVTPSSLAKLAL